MPRNAARIEVYDNSHIQGTNAVGAMIVAGPEGLSRIISEVQHPVGGPHARRRLRMMREVLQRRFKRLLENTGKRRTAPSVERTTTFPPWPDLVVIDGGQGQLNAARADFCRARS